MSAIITHTREYHASRLLNIFCTSYFVRSRNELGFAWRGREAEAMSQHSRLSGKRRPHSHTASHFETPSPLTHLTTYIYCH